MHVIPGAGLHREGGTLQRRARVMLHGGLQGQLFEKARRPKISLIPERAEIQHL